MKYHIQISIHPIRKNEHGEDYIDTDDTVYSYMTQGNGLSAYDAEELSDAAFETVNEMAIEEKLEGFEGIVGGLWHQHPDSITK